MKFSNKQEKAEFVASWTRLQGILLIALQIKQRKPNQTKTNKQKWAQIYWCTYLQEETKITGKGNCEFNYKIIFIKYIK